MKKPDRKYLGAFFAGFLWGLVLMFIFSVTYLRKNIILEYQSKYGFEETIKKFVDNVMATKGWTVKVGGCNLPESKDRCNMRLLKLCNAEYANAMTANENDRKVSAVIPCSIAVYEKPDGKTYISRLNVSLMGRFLGGAPGELFPGKIASEQNAALKSVIE
jgi:uncharacterized protein (DUF302 family)